MSETVVTESASTSTSDAAEAVIDAFEQTETTTTDAGSDSGDAAPSSADAAPETAESAPAAKTEPEPKKLEAELSDEEKLLAEFGFKHAKKPDGRDHYIARPKVLQMLASGLKRGTERWASERTALDSKVQALETDLSQFVASVQGDPKAFLSELANHDPRYRAFLEPQAAPQTAQQAAPASMGDRPGPDVQLSDGSRTYSLEGIQKLLDWNTARVEAQLTAKVDERLKPLAEREKAEQSRVETERAFQQVHQRATESIKEAESWPLFGKYDPNNLNEVQQEIMAALKADSDAAKAAGRRPTMSLHSAYMKVVGPKLMADDQTRRERLLKELNGAPRSTSVPRAGGEQVKAPTGPLSTTDITARTLARLERGA